MPKRSTSWQQNSRRLSVHHYGRVISHEMRFVTGCAYNLQITYADKRKEVLTGDVAGGMFDSILEKFVHDIFQE